MVLEGASNGMISRRRDVSCWVDKGKVFAAGFPDKTREFAVGTFANPLSDSSTQGAEYIRGAHKVKACKVAMVKNDVVDLFDISRNKLNYIRG